MLRKDKLFIALVLFLQLDPTFETRRDEKQTANRRIKTGTNRDHWMRLYQLNRRKQGLRRMLIVSLREDNILWAQPVRKWYLFPQAAICLPQQREEKANDNKAVLSPSGGTATKNKKTNQLTESPVPAAGVAIEKLHLGPLFT